MVILALGLYCATVDVFQDILQAVTGEYGTVGLTHLAMPEPIDGEEIDGCKVDGTGRHIHEDSGLNDYTKLARRRPGRNIELCDVF